MGPFTLAREFWRNAVKPFFVTERREICIRHPELHLAQGMDMARIAQFKVAFDLTASAVRKSRSSKKTLASTCRSPERLQYDVLSCMMATDFSLKS